MKTPEELAQQYTSTIADTHSVKAACEKAFIAGYKAAQEQGTDNAKNFTLENILGMTIEEFLYKHSEEIAEEVLNNNPLLKELKDE
jgi:hypothetical protein